LEVEIMDNFDNKDNNEQNIEVPKENIEESVRNITEEQQQIAPEPQVHQEPQFQAPPQPVGHHNYYEPTPPVKEKRRRSPGLAYLAMGLIGALIGGFIMAAIAPTYLYGKVIPYPSGNSGTTQLGQQLVIKPTDNVTVATAVAKKNMPAVVGISTVTTQQDFFGYTRQEEGVGAGFVVNSNGYIVTNAHVVEGAPDKITVYFMDGKEMPGTVLWQDTTLDMAVVKVAANNLPVVELGDSDNLQVGETAIAIGNPLGLRYERTVTQGIVSGLNRSIRVSQTDIMEDLIQTDAAINPGNSGGPLINASGQIIGINTAKASAEGLGFAIPINIAKPIINQLISTGKFQTPYIGIGLLD
jgi:S1-C subfamily serine protease